MSTTFNYNDDNDNEDDGGYTYTSTTSDSGSGSSTTFNYNDNDDDDRNTNRNTNRGITLADNFERIKGYTGTNSDSYVKADNYQKINEHGNVEPGPSRSTRMNDSIGDDDDDDTWSTSRSIEIASNRKTGYPKSPNKGTSVTTGHTVGQDNVTGETIINDGQGSNIQGMGDKEPKPMRKASANRDNVEQGSRDLNIQNTNQSVESGGKSKAGGKVSKSGGLTKGEPSTDEMDPCKPGQTTPGQETENDNDTDNGGGLGAADTPDPPANPTDPLAIDTERFGQTNTEGSGGDGGGGGGSSTTWHDPPPSSSPDNSSYTPPSNPDNPDEGGKDNDTPPEGCGGAEDDCQWYNVSSSDDPCPNGTSSKGFANLGDGEKMKLCCGDNRPPGDGCPNDPTEAGWECVDGECNLIPGGGIYATISECEENCGSQGDDSDPTDPEPIQRYACVSGECVQQDDGPFESFTACKNSGCDLPPLDENGTYTVTAQTTGNCLGEPNTCKRKVSNNYYFALYECGEECPQDSPYHCTPGSIAGDVKEVEKSINGPIDKFNVVMNASEDEVLGNGTGDMYCSATLVAVFPDGSTTNIISECGSFPISDHGDKAAAISYCENKGIGIGYFSPQVDPPSNNP